MKSLFVITFLVVSYNFNFAFAQFAIGHTTITFNDPARTGGYGSGGGPGRQIQTEIYYPGISNGDDVAVVNGQFPIIVFGHGFAMTWSAYQNIWEELVPLGYVIAFPRTEGSIFPSPSHGDFGLDLVIVEEKLSALNANAASIFYNKLTDKSAIMGHSMGGGSSILAAANNANITTVIGLAPAETTPSAITQASQVTVPALIFTADQDFVTPSADHHLPIYNGLNAACKYYINILGGAHCYYANANLNCDFGESSSGGNITITREYQQEIMFSYLIPWLDMYLKEKCARNVFEVDLLSDSDVTFLSACTNFPNANFDLTITNNLGELTVAEINQHYQWVDCSSSFDWIIGETNQSFTPTQNGSYAVIVDEGLCADTSACYNLTSVSLVEYSEMLDEQQIYKVYDLSGREVNLTTNTFLMVVYLNGQVKKVFIQE